MLETFMSKPTATAVPSAQQMLAKIQIEKRLAQHARGIDRADETLLRTAYHDDGSVDYGSLKGPAAVFAQAIAAMHQHAPMSLHRPSNTMIKLLGNEAISESYVMAWVTLPTDGDAQPHWVGGRYLDTHRCRNGDWRMQHRRYILDWIAQYPQAPEAENSAAFSLTTLTPTGGHYLSDPGNALLMAYGANSAKATREQPPMNNTDALDQVISHHAIVELGCKYARGVDRGDPDIIMTAFHDDASVISGAFNGSAKAFATEVTKMIDDIASCTAHTVTNHWIEIDGDNAVGESYVIAYQGLNGDQPLSVLTGGRYIDKYERRHGRWKIAQRTFVSDWTTTSPAKDLLHLGMFADMEKGQRNKSDPVYAFWDSLSAP